MDDAEYKRLCAAPDVMSRTDLRATAIRLRDDRPDLAVLIDKVLRSEPVPKPARHTNGSESDFLWLDFSDDDLEAIHDALRDQEIALADDELSPTPELSFVAALAGKWNAAESSRTDAV